MINSEDFLGNSNVITQLLTGYTPNGGVTRKVLPTKVKASGIDVTTGSSGHLWALITDAEGYVTALDVSWYAQVQNVNQFFQLQVRGLIK